MINHQEGEVLSVTERPKSEIVSNYMKCSYGIENILVELQARNKKFVEMQKEIEKRLRTNGNKVKLYSNILFKENNDLTILERLLTYQHR
jgi:hypothetical protein